MIPARQSTAFEVPIGPVLDADGVAVTGCVVADFKIKKTTGNFAALNGSATLTHVSAGMYDLVLTTSDMDTVGLNTIAIDDTVNACAPLHLQVMEEPIYDALYAASANTFTGAAGSTKVTGVVLVDTLTTYTSNTPQTGDSFARIGATGSGLTSLAPSATALSTAQWTNLRAGYLDNLSAGAVALASSLATLAGKFTGITLLAEWLGIIAGKQAGNSTARTEIRATGAGSGTYDETTDSLEANRDNIGTAGAGFSSLATAANVAAVEADTQDIQSRLPAALTGGRMNSDVKAVNGTAITGDGNTTPWGPA